MQLSVLGDRDTAQLEADRPTQFSHYRDAQQFEVDVVLEPGSRRVAGVEVKAAASVNARDFAGLRRLRIAAGGAFVCGCLTASSATEWSRISGHCPSAPSGRARSELAATILCLV
jgi:hypothetical protein